MGESYLKIGKAFGWTVVYLGVMLFYTFFRCNSMAECIS